MTSIDSPLNLVKSNIHIYLSKNIKQTAVINITRQHISVVKTFIYELDVSYAPTYIYIFRSNCYLNHN